MSKLTLKTKNIGLPKVNTKVSTRSPKFALKGIGNFKKTTGIKKGK